MTIPTTHTCSTSDIKQHTITPTPCKVCTDQLAPIFTQIFNKCLELCDVPCSCVCSMCSMIILAPKKCTITGLIDYRPVTLASIVMKLFERLVLAHLKDITAPLLDPCSLSIEQTDQCMMHSTWDCTTSCNTSTP